ncbi:hypothetical protein TrST_g14109 [Triparma strigata]|uniref:Phosphatidate cytidylyltransferase n=1 Tax=Triparma strigata TaxID=1606541 RepID=A0A9W7AAN1_9STRA|nr:hypothetical protein TrST_g14109 [Triparma strigata]
MSLPQIPTLHLILFITLLLPLLEFSPLPPFPSRKLCHSLCGLSIMHLTPSDPLARSFVYLVSTTTICMTWFDSLPNFKFARERDVGITVYLLLVSFWFYMEMDPKVLGPVFFADPAGAVVGKAFDKFIGGRNFKVCGNKSVCGSLAVFGVTYFTIFYECERWERGGISLGAMAVEMVGGEWDNLGLAAIVLAGWKLCGGKS